MNCRSCMITYALQPSCCAKPFSLSTAHTNCCGLARRCLTVARTSRRLRNPFCVSRPCSSSPRPAPRQYVQPRTSSCNASRLGTPTSLSPSDCSSLVVFRSYSFVNTEFVLNTSLFTKRLHQKRCLLTSKVRLSHELCQFDKWT